MTDHSSPVNDALMGKSLAEAHRLLQESGYNFGETHPECYRNFSYVKLFQLIEADRIRAQQMPSAEQRLDEDMTLFNNAREEAIEECAMIADKLFAGTLTSNIGKLIAERIRALSALTSPGCGEVDPTRPACGQGDEWGRKPTDEGYGHD